MPTFKFTATTAGSMRWNAANADPNNPLIVHPNHDSHRTLAEVEKLVEDGLRFFWQTPAKPTWAKKIKEAHAEVNGPRLVFIKIIKGIHQRNTDPHIRIQIKEVTAHVQLSMASAESLQHWQAVGIIVYGKNNGDVPVTLPTAMTRAVPRAGRGGSVSLSVVDAARVISMALRNRELTGAAAGDDAAYNEGLSALAGMFPI